MMEKKGYLRQIYETQDTRECARILQEGMRQISRELNDLMNRHLEDMPMVLACIKGFMPHWERHVGSDGMQICSELLRDIVAVDVSLLRKEEQ